MSPATRNLIMKPAACFLSLLTLLFVSADLRAENGCPSGMIPYSGTDLSSCGPIPPGYYQNGERSTAPPMRWVSTWGSIATDAEAGSVGTITGARSKEDAEDLAITDCRSKGGSQCKIQVAYDNECAAMVVGNKVFNVATDPSLNEAVRIATNTCQKDDTNCHIYYSACSPPQRVQ